jgi:hypothetical protein
VLTLKPNRYVVEGATITGAENANDLMLIGWAESVPTFITEVWAIWDPPSLQILPRPCAFGVVSEPIAKFTDVTPMPVTEVGEVLVDPTVAVLYPETVVLGVACLLEIAQSVDHGP